MRPQVINYRNPDTPDGRRYVGALTHLRCRSGAVTSTALALIIGGTPLLFIGPLVLGSIFWFATMMLFQYYPWSWFFGAALVIVIPSLFLGEVKQRGGWHQTGNLDTGPSPDFGDPDPDNVIAGDLGYIEALVMNPRVAASGIVEIFLVGPRLVLDGIAKLRRARQLRDVSLERAAEMVTQLSYAEGGMPVRSLLRDGETPDDVVRILSLLAFHDWIGVSKGGHRIWLHSDARRRLTT